jgi:adenosine deaminase
VSDDWRLILAEGVAKGDIAALRRVPKADLHCHGLLSAPIASYARLASQPLAPVPGRFANFEEFGAYIGANLLPVVAGGRHVVAALVRDTFERFVADGVVYAEPSFDLLLPELLRLSAAELAELLAGEVERVADRVTIALEVGIDRSLPADLLLPRLRDCLATGVFQSLDLYAHEAMGSIDDFVPLYRLAEEHGLRLKAHAGELCGAERVRESVGKLNLHAVQHGVRAAEDQALVDQLAERGTRLHICPTSNVALGVCASLAEHPAPRLFRSGVKLTVNSDDYALFGAGVSEELLSLSCMGFEADEIAEIVANGLAERRARDS